jgi:hypothetical protein
MMAGFSPKVPKKGTVRIQSSGHKGAGKKALPPFLKKGKGGSKVKKGM